MSNWVKYTYGTAPGLLPLEEAPWFPDEEIKAAGFDPGDEEVVCCVLSEEWNGHPKGGLVVTGLTVEGHPFAVETTS